MRKRIVAATVVLSASAGVLGLGAGVAVAVGPVLLAPTGLNAGSGSATEPMPDPTYAVNQDGLTYGSARQANSPGTEPDLIQAVATNGAEGYVLKSDLDEANGTTAAESFTSPEEALAWQVNEGAADRSIPVYRSDGVTVIGEFLITGTDSQQRSLARDDRQR